LKLFFGGGESARLLLSAFQIPGCVNEIKPTIITLKRGLLYHRVKRETGLMCDSLVFSISGSMTLSDMTTIHAA
jgi:hypothetical protein